MSVRVEYRKEFDNETFAESQSARITRMSELSSSWLNDRHDVSDDMDVDEISVERGAAWAQYYHKVKTHQLLGC